MWKSSKQKNVHTVLFVSRNKDNRQVPGFKPRTLVRLRNLDLYTLDGLQLLPDETLSEQVQREFTEFI